ncbi:MAG TPA: acetyl-CoA C-acetyltransferase [Chloroflexi bacterium]|nr:acetyl-CoA C-acetyltransferase [Chloroflexota bacterium]
MTDKRDVVIIGAARTAIGRFGGTISRVPAVELGGHAIRAAVERAGVDPASVDEVLVGQVIQAGSGQAPARQAALNAGLPHTVGATAVNKVCGSGLKTVSMGANAIMVGEAQIIVAAGMESMNRGPYLLSEARTGYRLGSGELIDATVHDGLWCSVENWHMGNSAELIAEAEDISREEMDEYALRSHRRAIKAIEEGKFREEIVPLVIPQRKGEPLIFDTDENPRADTSVEALGRLPPAFKADGKCTAGNSSAITDGAAAVVITSAEKARELGIQPLARITGFAQAAVEPKWVFIAPVHAIEKLLDKTGYDLQDFELVEINEAFASQMIADVHKLGLDWDRVNVHGGAIALGHPIGCSGTRVLVTLLHAMKDRGARLGLAALCLGGGEAVAMSVEMMP